ncbi:hypothetical protein ACQ4PT_016674 [Festuca glaucescens]
MLSPAAEPTSAADDLSPAEARLAMMELANMISVPMALTAVIRLGVPAAIWAGGANAPPPGRRPPPVGPPGPLRPRAPPPPASLPRRLLRAHHGRHRPAHHQDALVLAWPRLRDAVLDPAGPEPFARAHGGVPAYAYYGQDREANEVMLRAMTGVSEPFMEALLDGYGGGFEGVETLVDVGGSSGACLEMIMRSVPTIREGVNFDLPDVVAAAPPIAGKTIDHPLLYELLIRYSSRSGG